MAYQRAALRPALIALAIVAAASAALLWLTSASASDDDLSQGDVRRQADVVRELPELRTRASRTYSTRRGTQITRAYADPVNFRSDGKWRAIDNDLEPSPKAGIALENAANDYTLALPDSLAQPVEVREGEDYVRFALEGASGAPSGGGIEARYEGALPGVDVAYQAEADAVKESLVLASPDAGSKFVFKLDLSDGLDARENGAGGIDFVRDGKVRMSFAPPYMRDSARVPEVSDKVSLTLDGDAVVLRADEDWLRSNERAYPVVIDPTTNVDTNDDCYMVSGNDANTTFCGYTDPLIQIGKDGNNNLRRAFMRVDTSAIPKVAEVIDGKLFLYVESGTQRNVDLHRVTQQSTSARTWNKYDGVNNWTTAGGTISGSPDGSNSAFGGTAGWYSIAARKLAQGWVDGSTPNYGLIVKDNGLTAGVLNVTGDAANDPYMEFEWVHRTGIQDRWTFADQQLSDRMALKTNVANGNLILEESDISIPGTAGHDLDFKRYFNNLEFDTNSSTDDLGKYWRQNQGWAVWLAPESNDTARAFNGPSDFWAVYDDRDPTTGYYTTPTGMNADLKRNADGTHTLTYRQSNRKLNFNTGHLLTSDKDRNDNTISYTYGGPGGKLTAIKDSHDQGGSNTLSITYTGAGYIDTITDRSSPTRTWDYNYTGQLLTSYVNPDGKTTSYSYDANENLYEITDPRGNTTRMLYDSSHRVTSIQRFTDAGKTTGPITRYEYPTSLSSDCSGVGTGENTVVGETIERDPLWPGSGTTHTTKYCWDKLLRVQKTIDGRGESRKQDYTSNSDVENLSSYGAQAWKLTYLGDRPRESQATATANGNQLKERFDYDDANHPTTADPLHWLPSSFTDAQSKTSNYVYDSKGNLKEVQLPLPGTPKITIVPTANGPQSITDANGTGTTSYTYETDGDLDTVDRPGTSLLTEVFDYDVVHRLTSHQNANTPGITETYGYDKLDRPTSISYTGGASVGPYVYDDNGNITSRTDATGTSTYVYDRLNRLTQENLPGGRTNNYTYDNASNLATLQDAGGTTTYTYGASNLLATAQAPGDSAATTFSYNKDAQRTKTTYPNSVVLTMDYEDLTNTDGTPDSNDKGPNRLKSIEAKKTGGSVLTKFSYGFTTDATLCGGTSVDTALRQSVTSAAGTTSKYCYDALNRLTKASNHNGSTYDYTLDRNGNVTKVVKGATTTSFGYEIDNRLCWKVGGSEPDAYCSPTPTGATTYAHDTSGNLDTSSAGLNLDYNSKGQTTSMTGLSGGSATSMSYAGPNQFERFTAGGATFTNNALGVGAETTGTSTSYYRRDNEGGLLSERLPSGAIYYYAFDGLGSVSALTDTSGTAQALYSYEPYGETTASGPAPATANPWKYASSYLDSSTGFYKMGLRYYRPELMRWTQQDVVEQPTGPVEANRYGYAADDPMNKVDPSGAAWCWGPSGRWFCRQAGRLARGTARAIGRYALWQSRPRRSNLRDVTTQACLIVGTASAAAGAACTLATYGVD